MATEWDLRKKIKKLQVENRQMKSKIVELINDNMILRSEYNQLLGKKQKRRVKQ